MQMSRQHRRIELMQSENFNFIEPFIDGGSALGICCMHIERCQHTRGKKKK